jgi:hypothetical protein
MVSLMAQNNCRTWLTMVTNTSQPYPAVAGSQRTLVYHKGWFGAGVIAGVGDLALSSQIIVVETHDQPL